MKNNKDDKNHFVVEIPLKTTPHARAKLRKWFNVYTHVYNAALAYGLKRVKKLHKLPEWERTGELTKKIKLLKNVEKLTSEQKQLLNQMSKERKEIYDNIRKNVFSESLLQKYVQNVVRKKGTFIWDNTISTLCNTLSKRAYLALEKYQWRKAKKVSFVSVEGRRNKRYNKCLTCLSDGNSSSKVFIIKGRILTYKKLVMNLMIDDNDLYHQYFDQNRELIGELKLVRKHQKGGWQYYLQATMTGNIPRKQRKLGVGDVGIDIGPSLLACVSLQKAEIRLLSQLTDLSKYRRIMQRRLDRQRRANNPDCYDEKGRCIKGKRPRNKSKRQIQTEKVLREIERCEREHRKCLHGALTNNIREQGDCVHTEKNNIKSWQKRKKSKKGTKKSYGKSIQRSAPAMLLSKLKYKFESTGGQYKEIDIRAKLSQTCPNCLKAVKKSIGQRIHRCDCGYVMQRDLTSALLAIATTGKEIDGNKAKKLCEELGPLLRTACAEASAKVCEEKSLTSRFGSASELKEISLG